MKKKKNINIVELSKSFNKKKIGEKTLDKLFYYSLFDSTSFEEEDEFFPIKKIVDYKNGIRKLLKKIFKRGSFSSFFKDSDSFEEFETRVIASDILSKIILIKKLNTMGVGVTFHKGSDFDLQFKKGFKGELKRICLWTNYPNYWNKFFKKIKSDGKYIYLVACTHPFIIEKIVPKKANRNLFDKYLSKMIRSHYLLENFIKNENVIFVIRYIHIGGDKKYNLNSLCEEIKDKINS